ncbi:MAG: VWA-like domain-containing protein [Clostridiales bacterium]|uniref:vWA domain-containing protein n=1 Tax=Terrisporobacter sp. TaxID=1965305 RepID=UPI002A586EEF|nr:VWA-like domain-containing protein [Terrisporobacter sp.]MCI5630716.1 VWA-like domain-containing protein [Clostridium sp.]MDD7753608.1 VWA-like domain-containing protein [Clostridiales bacterium]MCI6457316.1 VWA-like domain-containing protein [Clostridium sp.]MCI7207878.1 VWA-like domain-containing protein [Clostridium sp.]MDY4137513.1 VWA-like domain-containing protein [Terrisporobacter sp.]
MASYFEEQAKELYDRALEVVNVTEVLKSNRKGNKFEVKIEEDFKRDFFSLVNKVNLSLMEDNENFYGYFLFQMEREIRFDISSATSVNFKGAKYVMYFNPIIFLELNMKQMETTIKHEILHVISQHLIRAKELKGKYSTLALNISMDVVVNQYLDYLPPYSITLEYINNKYDMKLEPYKTFEYYLEKVQTELDLQEENDEGEEVDSNENVIVDFDPERTHDMWEESDEVDEKTLNEFTEKFADSAQKGKNPNYIDAMIKSLKNRNGELPWNLFLKKLMGTIEANKKKTVTRRNRRQPSRLDLRGELRGHKAEIAVAIDISGSISDEEFKQAIKEVLAIVKSHNQEITIIECDKEIRRAYKVKSPRDVQERIATGGGTKFSPVFEYANNKKINLLIYFTDGKGEEKLEVIPRGYKTLWVISGRGDKLSLREPFGVVKKLKKVDIKQDTIDMADVRSDGYSMNNQAPML